MTDEHYRRERARLLEILKDALDRGDYYLEKDVTELFQELDLEYYSKDSL